MYSLTVWNGCLLYCQLLCLIVVKLFKKQNKKENRHRRPHSAYFVWVILLDIDRFVIRLSWHSFSNRPVLVVCILDQQIQNKLSLDLFWQSYIIWVPWSMLNLVNFNKKMWKKILSHGSLPSPRKLLNQQVLKKKKKGILIFACAWHWLLSVGDISISARRHNPPLLIIITTKLPAGEALMWRTSPCPMKAQGYERCDRVPRSFTQRRALQWLRRPLGSFSESRKKSRGINSGCLGWVKGNLSACHNARLLWRGTCLVRVVWSHTVVRLQRLSAIHAYQHGGSGSPVAMQISVASGCASVKDVKISAFIFVCL